MTLAKRPATKTGGNLSCEEYLLKKGPQYKVYKVYGQLTRKGFYLVRYYDQRNTAHPRLVTGQDLLPVSQKEKKESQPVNNHSFLVLRTRPFRP